MLNYNSYFAPKPGSIFDGRSLASKELPVNKIYKLCPEAAPASGQQFSVLPNIFLRK